MTTNPITPSVFICRLFSATALIVLFAITGCQTAQTPKTAAEEKAAHIEALILREGDVVKVTVVGSTGLDASQPIRRDGKIVLKDIGEVQAAGKTPKELEKDINKLYATQLLNPEDAVVTVESSSFPVFVTGAVARPGRVQSDHPLTVLEAIMEAGGFNYATANLKAVTVVRTEEGHTKNYKLNMKRAMQQDTDPFYLKPSDIIYVPEKFSWF